MWGVKLLRELSGGRRRRLNIQVVRIGRYNARCNECAVLLFWLCLAVDFFSGPRNVFSGSIVRRRRRYCIITASSRRHWVAPMRCACAVSVVCALAAVNSATSAAELIAVDNNSRFWIVGRTRVLFGVVLLKGPIITLTVPSLGRGRLCLFLSGAQVQPPAIYLFILFGGAC